jgi:hypothetical protein
VNTELPGTQYQHENSQTRKHDGRSGRDGLGPNASIA